LWKLAYALEKSVVVVQVVQGQRGVASWETCRSTATETATVAIKMPLTFIDRSASVGWCPVGHQALVAAGTQSGAIDISFSTSSVLEVSAGHAVG
jgi:hypothetical protein